MWVEVDNKMMSLTKNTALKMCKKTGCNFQKLPFLKFSEAVPANSHIFLTIFQHLQLSEMPHLETVNRIIQFLHRNNFLIIPCF